MKQVSFLFLVVFGLLVAACSSNNDTWGDWGKAPEFGGDPRTGAVSFQIGDKVYVGLGYGKIGKTETELRDLWKLQDGLWSKVDSFPGHGRVGAVAFMVGTKAYVGTGYQLKTNVQDEKFYSDFYEFDTATDTWNKTPITNFPGDPRRDATGFTFGGLGYVGMGSVYGGSVKKDLYTYDGTTWREIGFPGDSRRGGSAMVFKDFVVICLGTSPAANRTDVWKFTPGASEPWVQMLPLVDQDNDRVFDDDYAQIPRAYAVTFVSSKRDNVERGYAVTGATSTSSTTRICWEYNPQSDRWEKVTDLINPILSRQQAVGYVLNGFGYFTTGSSGFDSGSNGFNDTWRFNPAIEEDDYNDYQVRLD